MLIFGQIQPYLFDSHLTKDLLDSVKHWTKSNKTDRIQVLHLSPLLPLPTPPPTLLPPTPEHPNTYTEMPPDMLSSCLVAVTVLSISAMLVSPLSICLTSCCTCLSTRSPSLMLRTQHTGTLSW
ncbi:hypothetical protein E2C01_075891 [Portunus trituberculatus]|uniref:Uncharacterized protein n=1 Tax=Portunus trituberculatus TaxID=210409 RepID=A0A5B7IG43_PORTR|nr:hypothetical protein [Portunus trituberculatus]